MNIATYELLIPHTIGEIERRAARARAEMPARPAGWSPSRWLRARRATRADAPAATAAMVASDALTRSGIATGTPRIA